MLMNNKSVMRTFEAIIAAVIMILGVSFILSDYGTTFSSNPSWEVINARNSAEDVLVILEKGVVNNQSELGYYINDRQFSLLETKLNSLIPPGYAYKFNIFEITNIVYINTQGDASLDSDNPGVLTNGYKIGTLSNNSNIWKFHETQTGWPGDYTIYFPDGGSVKIYGLLLVDSIDEVPGYDTVYLKLERGNPLSALDFSTSTTKLSSSTPLRVGDIVSFSSYSSGTIYEYTFQISNIARDGNSISFALLDETLYVDLIGTNTKIINIFNDTFRFTLNNTASETTLDIEKKIGEPNQFTTYTKGLRRGDWTVFGNYSGNIKTLSFDGINGHIIINLVPYKKSILSIEKPGEMESIISAKRIVSTMDTSSNVRAYYVSLIMGRKKL
ncbi:MAG: hypothetical protein APG12_00301 [Candidatus Methanofastidiosum methylothiophilum]|uniref:Uncharacterized protein n=1 Tax=Candidatus Methanofastidiosum methylothiophilum TaxID=1705564 RepID=A0A150IUJ3_9EURY|nr:MAG: hypothetical protein APG10_00335 [Candidatus Methanofastidiosum methylthiophilus]KYC48620.1 MAG: hypothetical protein APG11_00130 [Candidatus Methanofastidiosum methylthiophilus]KYC51175.1 MAG: hypothetical protein APG12_00301 [Candidatus Methanofastidiosum methylthiophilus]